MELLGDIKEEWIDNYTEKFIDIFYKTLNILYMHHYENKVEMKQN